MEDTLSRIKRVLLLERSTPPEKITENTSILFELGVQGDDGDELISALEREFGIILDNVDVSVFGGEGLFSCPSSSDFKIRDLINLIEKKLEASR
jgi:acyl carrier protein